MLLYFIHFLIITAISLKIWQSAKKSILRPFFWLGLALKITAGLALGWIYLRFYANINPLYPMSEKLFFMGDSWAYFAHGQMITELASKDWEIYLNWLFQDDYFVYERLFRSAYNNNHRAVFMYRIIHIFNYLTDNNYWLISVYFSLFSFFGLWKCAEILARIYPKTKYALGIGFFLFPSVVFWSAGILKETLLVGCLGLVISIILNLYYFNKLKKLSKTKIIFLGLQIMFCFWIILRVKYYYFAVFVPILIAYLTTITISKRFQFKNWTELSLFFGILGVFLAMASLLHYNLNFNRILTIIVQNYHSILASTPPENKIEYFNLNPTIQSFIQNSGRAFVGVFLRPFPWESGSLMKIPARLENVFLYALIVSNLILFIKNKKLYFKSIDLLLIASLIFMLILGIMMALATPNIGTLIRFKVGFMPFLIYLLSIQPSFWIENKIRNRGLFFGQ